MQFVRSEDTLPHGALGCPNYAKRYIRSEYFTADGELAGKASYSLDQEMIEQESRYDGFHAVCTDLEAGAPEIMRPYQKQGIIDIFGFRVKTQKKRVTFL